MTSVAAHHDPRAERALRGARGDEAVLGAIAALVRVAVILWAAPRFPPADDGKYYHVIASRIAEGNGYTWLWPDGAVTFAAHYPVGYPALLGGAYALLGAHPGVAMALHVPLAVLGTLAVRRVAASAFDRRGAFVAGGVFALHPALVAHAPALMTESVSAALLAVAAAAALALRGSSRGVAWGVVGLLLGATAMIRPQLLLVAPAIGALTAPSGVALRRVFAGAGVVTAIAVAACVPWTLRNCQRMGACAFVSANGGWNLYIGTARDGRGTWVPLESIGVPAECREVHGEAAKDSCFGAAGLRRIRADPAGWLALAPAKLGATFDGAVAAASYLHASNPIAFPGAARDRLGAAEVTAQRLTLLAALLALARAPGPRRRARWAVALGAAPFALTPLAWPAWLGVPLGAALLGRGLARHPPALLAAASVVAIAATHVVFFGAGRYALPALAGLAALAGGALGGRSPLREWASVGASPGAGEARESRAPGGASEPPAPAF
ncbi:MAG: hypothetical protein IT376_13970 [Polyangiaceae bacterium]|nr:hypothetical protein [Polyangiaceae bacterium]